MQKISKILMTYIFLTFSIFTVAKENPADLLQAEAEIDDGLKKFGYLTGLSLGCVTSEQKADLEREAMDVNSEIARTLGLDRAFLFSASFGYGSNIELKIEECAEVLKRYEEKIDSFRKSRGVL